MIQVVWLLKQIFRIRAANDVQYAFAYNYFLAESLEEISDSEIFAEFDRDKSGVLSDREMRLLITKIHELPIRLEHLTALEDDLKECYDNKTYHEQVKNPEKYFDKKMPQVTEKFALSCPKFLDRIEVVKKGKKKYKTKELDDSEIEFQMIGSNVSSVIGQLDHVRKNQKKFLCINDNMDHSSKGKASKYWANRDWMFY